MTTIEAGYRAYTGHVFSAVDAATYNAAADKAFRRPTDTNLNGAHNLFSTIANTPLIKMNV
jgi:hypothetical protein